MAYLGAGITRFNTADDLTVTGDAQIDTNTLVVDSTNNRVGIGTTSPSSALHISAANNSQLFIAASDTNSTTAIFETDAGASERVRLNNKDGAFTVDVSNTTEAMRIDTSGNVGIGTTSINGKLDIRGSGNTDIYLNTGNNSGDNNRLFFGDTADIDVGYVSYDHGVNAMTFGVNAAERMRIDSSGNFLVAKTSTGNTVGAELRASGYASITRDGNVAFTVRRLTSDGSIMNFQKDTAEVGKIVSRSGVQSSIALDPRTSGVNGAGLSGGSLSSTAGVILPTDGSGAIEDNTIDLGHTDYRFKDLKIGGGIYLGGTTSTNYLTDYEEGTWTAGCTGTLNSLGARYVKIGNYVNVSFYATGVNPTADNNVFKITGLPFAVKTSSGYYVAGSIGYTGSVNLNDIVTLSGTGLSHIYFHFNDGDGSAVTGNEMRAKGMTGDSGDALIISLSYCSG